jgi:succinate dehydrogenase / fumarate reductase, cytochrome b subunit
MKLFNAFKGTAEEVKLNPNVGTFSWILHRISGLMLLGYLFAHMWVLGSAQGGPGEFDKRIKLVQSPLFHILEIGLVLVIFYHMINGLAIGLMDFANISRKHKTIVTITVIIFVLLAIATVATMLPRALHHVPTGGVNAIS